MTERTTITITALVPRGTEHRLLQYIRNYDVVHGDCRFGILIDRTDLTAEQAIEMVQLTPSMAVVTVTKTKGEADGPVQ